MTEINYFTCKNKVPSAVDKTVYYATNKIATFKEVLCHPQVKCLSKCQIVKLKASQVNIPICGTNW